MVSTIVATATAEQLCTFTNLPQLHLSIGVGLFKSTEPPLKVLLVLLNVYLLCKNTGPVHISARWLGLGGAGRSNPFES
jgi:hypothetical protein